MIQRELKIVNHVKQVEGYVVTTFRIQLQLRPSSAIARMDPVGTNAPATESSLRMALQ
jgi:hypothetical protein